MLPLNTRKTIKEKIYKKLRPIFDADNFLEKLSVKTKDDKSPVTEIDTFISDQIKKIIQHDPELMQYTFYSEEDHNELKFPCVILDPIDGTRELVKGIGECSLSLGIFRSPLLSDSWGWIFNPFTGFEILSENQKFIRSQCHDGKLSGLVSRSECKRGLFSDYNTNRFILTPRGSIAFKLGLLGAGASDFVISKRPKSIWDIAAGTSLCLERGISLYLNNKKVSSLSEKRIEGPLVWCREEYFEQIKSEFL